MDNGVGGRPRFRHMESLEEQLMRERPYFQPVIEPIELHGAVLARWRQVGTVADSVTIPCHILELNLAGQQRVRPCFDGIDLPEASFRSGDFSLFPSGARVAFTAQMRVDVVQIRLPEKALAGLGATIEPRPKFRNPHLERAVLRLLSRGHAAMADVLLAEELVGNVTTVLVAHLGKPAASSLRLTRKQQRTLCEFINDTLHQHISRQRMADAIGVSPSHLSHCCESAFGLSPYQLVLELRMERAKALARCTNLRAEDIAHRCGLQTISQFSKLFAARAGVTFREYRTMSHASGVAER